MDKVTREEKWERFRDYFEIVNDVPFDGPDQDDIDRAILADYAPLTPERRAELKRRRRIIWRAIDIRNEHKGDCTDLVRWLREIDAELEVV